MDKLMFSKKSILGLVSIALALCSSSYAFAEDVTLLASQNGIILQDDGTYTYADDLRSGYTEPNGFLDGYKQRSWIDYDISTLPEKVDVNKVSFHLKKINGVTWNQTINVYSFSNGEFGPNSTDYSKMAKGNLVGSLLYGGTDNTYAPNSNFEKNLSKLIEDYRKANKKNIYLTLINKDEKNGNALFEGQPRLNITYQAVTDPTVPTEPTPKPISNSAFSMHYDNDKLAIEWDSIADTDYYTIEVKNKSISCHTSSKPEFSMTIRKDELEKTSFKIKAREGDISSQCDGTVFAESKFLKIFYVANNLSKRVNVRMSHDGDEELTVYWEPVFGANFYQISTDEYPCYRAYKGTSFTRELKEKFLDDYGITVKAIRGAYNSSCKGYQIASSGKVYFQTVGDRPSFVKLVMTGNADSSLSGSITCLKPDGTRTGCSLTGNRPRGKSCSVNCPVGSLATMTCETTNPRREVDKATFVGEYVTVTERGRTGTCSVTD